MSAEQDLANANVQIANLISEVTRFRDAAMGINNIWPTITEGRNNTADGKYFSVPGNGAYMRLYRRQGSTAELIAEFPDRAELNSVIDQLGSLLSNRDILGTVSQDGGVPTGAIIEEGSTTLGGRYRKFADGSMECWMTFQITDVGSVGSGTIADLYRSSSWNWDFPQSFVDSPEISQFCRCNSANAMERANTVCAASIGTTRLTNLQVFRLSSQNGSSSVFVTLTASGRWRT